MQDKQWQDIKLQIKYMSNGRKKRLKIVFTYSNLDIVGVDDIEHAAPLIHRPTVWTKKFILRNIQQIVSSWLFGKTDSAASGVALLAWCPPSRSFDPFRKWETAAFTSAPVQSTVTLFLRMASARIWIVFTVNNLWWGMGWF